MRKFNVTGNCIPSENYMVDISGKIAQIKELIDNGYYLTINEARQYGKTTTLYELRRYLKAEYIVAHISFQGVSNNNFISEENFCESFTRHVAKSLRLTADKEYAEKWKDISIVNFDLLSDHITDMCEDRKVILMIDEVDNVSNNHIFVKFLNMLREKFIARRNGDDYTFQSVILAGVYDIKNIKLKMVSEGLYTPVETENKLYNSPWNIVADFEIDMAFNSNEIATMLTAYESDNKTGMNITEISEEIYSYTSGYPFLVSRICQHINNKLNKDWTVNGVREAVKLLIDEKNTLFDDLFKNLENNAELYNFIYSLLIVGEHKTYSANNPTISFGEMFNIIKRQNGKITISNKIFEIVISDYFVSKDESNQRKPVERSGIIKNGRFDMELCLRKFAEHYAELYNEKDTEFFEREGKFLFITYIRPLLNGEGFYHFESELADLRRMDIVVDFGCEQFIIELKIWRGEKSHEEAYEQLVGYLETKKADRGYLLTFDFRKDANKKRKAEWVEINGTNIFDVIV